MNDLTQSEQFITTVDFLTEINSLRTESGEKPLQNSKFLKQIVDELPELEDEVVENFSTTSKNKYAPDRTVKGYFLTQDQALLVGMRQSRTIRRRVLKYLRSKERALSFAAAFDTRALTWKERTEALGYLPDAPQQGASARERSIYYGKATNLVYRIVTGKTAAQIKADPHRTCYPGKDPDCAYSYMSETELYWVGVLQKLDAELAKSMMLFDARRVTLQHRFETLQIDEQKRVTTL